MKMAKLRALYEKHRELVLYVFFGGLTSAVDALVHAGSFFLLKKPLGGENATLTAGVGAWVAAVAFAYVTNKLFVFEQKSWEGKILRKELPSFMGARLFSLAVQEALLFLLVKTSWKDGILAWAGPHLQWPAERLSDWYDLGAKLPVMVIVLVLNYVFSKWLVFKKEKQK